MKLPRVNQDTRLNFRVLDIRTPANQGIFRIQCQVGTVSLKYLLKSSSSLLFSNGTIITACYYVFSWP